MKAIKFLIPFLLYIVISLFSSLIRDIVDVFKFNLDMVNREYIFEKVFNPDTYISLVKEQDQLSYMGWTIIFMYIFFALINARDINLRKKYRLKSEYGSHGTARFQTYKEIKKNYTKNQLGWFFGALLNDENKREDLAYTLEMQGVYHPVDNILNMQVNVVGAPNSRKTTGFVLPNLLHLPDVYEKADNGEMPDLIVTDPKMEIFQYTAKHFEERKYDVRILDFLNFKYGDSLNVLDFIESEKDIMEVATNFVVSTNGGEGTGEQRFWDSQEAQLLSAIIGFVKQKKEKSKQTFTEVARVMSSEDFADSDKAMYFFKKNKVKGAVLQFYNNFLSLAESERTRANIIAGLQDKLKLFALEEVQRLTSSTTIDIRRFGAKKKVGEKSIILYIFMSDKDRVFSPIISVSINTILNQMYKTAEETESRLPNPVYTIWDEMANIGKIGNLAEKTGSMRGRRIYPMFIWQSLAQMKQRYKEWEDILGNCDTHIYLGINDKFTLDYVSDSLGQTTVENQGINRTQKHMQQDQKSESINTIQRKLMFPDEIKRMPRDLLIVSQGGANPMKLRKVQYRHWDEKYRIIEKKPLSELKLLESIEKVEVEESNNDVIDITEDEIVRKDHLDIIEKRKLELKKKLFEEREMEKEEVKPNPFRKSGNF